MTYIFSRFRIWSLVVVALFTGAQVSAQLVTYSGDASGALAFVATGAAATTLSRVNGASVPGAPCGSGFSSAGFSSATVYLATAAAVELTIAPDPGNTLDVSGITASLRRSGSGPANVRIAYSTDGGATWVDQGIDNAPFDGTCGTGTAASWTTSVHIAAPLQLMVRLYGYDAASASGVLQIINLSVNGAVVASATCPYPPGLSASTISTTMATVGWTAMPSALSYVFRYRESGAAAWSTLYPASAGVSLSSLTPATIYECQVASDCGSGAGSFSGTTYFTTATAGSASASSGTIVAYFNHPVDTSVSTGVHAVFVDHALADTLIAYFNRAQYTIDIAQYDYNQSAGYSSIATAINNAVARGVRVRWIYDGAESNTGIALLDTAVHTLASPTTSSYGIMHNKVVIIDAGSSNPNDAIVSSGSTVWGLNQFNTDYNNMLFIQDSALAHAYTDQFNQMWGGSGSYPNLTLSRFGPYKTDLGRHIFTIGGKTVELYFSPADNTDAHIQTAINSANKDLYFGMFTFTMATDADAIVARHTAGVYTPGIVDENSTLSGAAYPILTAGLGSLLKTHTGSVIYHNKMMVVDPSDICSDPLVLTGSHNWTNAAQTKNDENTLIIHSDTLANIYYQSFKSNYEDLGGTLASQIPCTILTCGAVSGLYVSGIGTTTALLHWSSVPGATGYTVRYRAIADTAWTIVTTTASSLTLSTLAPATGYEFSVRSDCSSGAGDYSSAVTFTTSALPCSAPAGISITVGGPDAAAISWISVSGSTGYVVMYRVVGATAWSYDTVTTNTCTLLSLSESTNYELQVEALCSTGVSPLSALQAFTTESSVCGIPGIAPYPATGITSSSAVLNWTAVTGAISYNIHYRAGYSVPWTTVSATTNWKILYGLSPSTIYQFQVQAVCAAGAGSYGSMSSFLTQPPSAVGGLTQGDAYVFPNPTTDAFYFVPGAVLPLRLELYSVTGVLEQQLVPTAGATIALTPQTAGVHVLRVVYATGVATYKVVRQ